MAYYLDKYILFEGLTQKQLADRFSWDFNKLKRVALCKAPVADEGVFNKEINQISEYAQVDAATLIQIIRSVLFRSKFGDVFSAKREDTLLAARERPEEPGTSHD